jgi:hypothetical protein
LKIFTNSFLCSHFCNPEKGTIILLISEKDVFTFRPHAKGGKPLMTKKNNQRQVASGHAAGKAGQRRRRLKEPASPPPTGTDSLSFVYDPNAMLAQAPWDRLGTVTTYVYDPQNCVTRLEEPIAPASPYAPDLQKLRKEKPRAAGQRAKGKAPKKSNRSHAKRRRG